MIWARRVLFLLAIAAVILFGLDKHYPLQLPNKEDSFARVVLDRQGKILRTFADKDGIWRFSVTQNQVSPYYLDALINYEDRWFYYHFGVNPIAMLRAAWQNWQAGRIISGGSTLTMQVVRLFHPHDRSVSGKLQQIFRAIQMEFHLSKKDILQLYLNYAPFGGTREGIQAASYQYLDKPAINLTRAEAALMAVLPQAPSRLRPDRYPQRAQLARDKVLNRLQHFAVWDIDDIQQAKKESVFAYTPQIPQLAPLLARRLIQENPQKSIINTTINADLQQVLETMVRDYAQGLPDGSSTAILVVDEKTNEVMSYVGSSDFDSKKRYGHVDLITAIRSPGSTLKPFLYALAIDAGLVHSASLLSDVPRDFSSYRPANFSHGFKGPVTLEYALKNSLNVPAVELLEHYGPVKFAAKLKNAGLHLYLPNQAKPNLSIILGGVGLKLEQLVEAYGAFTHNGQAKKLTYLKNDLNNKESSYLLSEGAAWIISHILKDIPRPDRLLNSHQINDHSKIAWKSGTSYGFRDAWSIGFNGQYRVGVWVGRPDGTPLPGHYGSLSAAPLLFNTFDLLGASNQTSTRPANVESVEICWPLGFEVNDTRQVDCHQKKKAWVLDGVVPKSLTALTEESDWLSNPYRYWVNTDTGLLVNSGCHAKTREQRQFAYWPKILEPWIEKKYQRQHAIPLTDKTCPHPINAQLGEIRITGVTERSILHATSKDITHITIRPKVIGARGQRWWFLNGKKISNNPYAQSLSMNLNKNGDNQLIVVDESGNSAKVNFRVDGLL